MTRRRMVMELGIGVDLQGGDYTKAAVRAVENALRQNSLTVADAFGVAREAMLITAVIGVAEPGKVATDAIAAVFPYGQVDVRVERGGMDTPKDDDSAPTVMANAAVLVDLDFPDDASFAHVDARGAAS